MAEYIMGRPALLLPVSRVAAYPGDAVETDAPRTAFLASGDGYAALVLNDPEATTFMATSTGGLLGQVIYADDWDAAPAALLESIPETGWVDMECFYETPDDESILFDAHYAGSSLDDPTELEVMEDMEVTPIRVPLPAGRYGVHAIVNHQPDAQTEWTLVRLERV